MATGRDAADVAITTSFGAAYLTNFYVESNEIDAQGNKLPLPSGNAPETAAAPPRVEASTPTQTSADSGPAQTQSATS
jgi:hypothetical protein